MLKIKKEAALLVLLISLIQVAHSQASEIILSENFDGATTSIDKGLAGTTSSITSTNSFSGVKSLYMDNQNSGKFSYRYPLGGSYDTLYARYMFMMGNSQSSCWSSNEAYKNMGFEGGTEECKGGAYTSDGTDCFTIRSRFIWPYMGVHVESAPYPGLFTYTDPNVKVNDGKWHCYEVKVQLNNPALSDGEIRTWVDGHETVKPNLRFRIVDTLKINKWWFTYWANDKWCGPLYLDDLVISKSRIGCPGTTPPNDTAPPIRSNGSPTGTLPSGTTLARMNLTTDESSTCRYSKTAGVAYQSMTGTFSTTGGSFHSVVLSGLIDGNTYTSYVRCRDGTGNMNSDDYVITFSIGSGTNPCSWDLFGSAGSPDGVVNLGDVLFVLKSMGKIPGDVGYDPKMNFNGNPQIDLGDVLTVLAHLGACPA